MRNCLLTILIIFSVAGCGEMRSKRRGDGDTSLFSVSSKKVVAIVSKNQVLPNFRRCLNRLPASAISSNTKSEIQNSLTTLAAEGEDGEISAPMLMTITKIVSEICNDLVDFEGTQTQTQRKYFQGYNLDNVESDATPGNNEKALQSARSLASSCWGRNAKPKEIELVTEALKKTPMNEKLNRSTALFLCTGILSTSAAVRF